MSGSSPQSILHSVISVSCYAWEDFHFFLYLFIYVLRIFQHISQTSPNENMRKHPKIMRNKYVLRTEIFRISTEVMNDEWGMELTNGWVHLICKCWQNRQWYATRNRVQPDVLIVCEWHTLHVNGWAGSRQISLRSNPQVGALATYFIVLET